MDNIALEHFVELFKRKDFRKKFVNKVNKNLDIPILNEKTEKKIYDAIYQMILETVEDMI